MANNSDVWQFAVIPGHGAAVYPESIFQRPVLMDSGPRSLGDPGMTFCDADQSFASRYERPGRPFVVEYSKCNASPGWTSGWIACAASAASAKPDRISLSFPG